MIRPLLIIKFGGSVITDKNKATPSPRLDLISSLSKQIKKLHHQKNFQIILVHGAGSYGHPIAKKYSLHKGMKTTQQKLAFSKINQIMLDLNKIVMESLIEQNIPVINFIPHTFIQQSAGKLQPFDLTTIKQSLNQNQIPVLFGDAVLDDQWGCSILSGDTIISYLAAKLGAHQVIFLSDVDGVFDSNPKKNPQAQIILEINNHNLDQVIGQLESHHQFDVTGEMKGKILSIQKDLRKITVIIGSGFRKRAIKRLLDEVPPYSKLLFD